MSKLLAFLSQTNTILVCLLVMLVTGGLFTVIPTYIGGDMLDLLWTSNAASLRIADMTAAQKTNHIWITLVLDSIYPLAYGGLLLGIIARLTKSWRIFAVMPAFITIATDFLENIIQICALTGFDNILFLKSVLTPIKFGGFILTSLIVFFLLIRVLLRRLRA